MSTDSAHPTTAAISGYIRSAVDRDPATVEDLKATITRIVLHLGPLGEPDRAWKLRVRSEWERLVLVRDRVDAEKRHVLTDLDRHILRPCLVNLRYLCDHFEESAAPRWVWGYPRRDLSQGTAPTDVRDGTRAAG